MDNYKLELAERCYAQGNYARAIETLKELLAENPNDAFCHGLLCANLLAQKRITAAEYEIGLALKLDPNESFFYIMSARICMIKKQLQQALELCDQALCINVTSLDALLTKNTIYQLLGQNQKAFNCINQAAQIAPDSIDVMTEFGMYYYSSGNNEKALVYAREALHSNAQDIDANLLMAKIQLSLGDVVEAEYHSKFVILQDPDNEQALTLFVDIKMRKNWLFGVWWKFNNILSNFSNLKSTIVLISAYLFFNLASQVAKDLGYGLASQVISYAWLALVIYTWIGLPYYKKVLKKELEKFSFNPNF